MQQSLKIKNELDSIIQDVTLPKEEYKRKALNIGFSQSFVKRGWEEQFAVFNDDDVEAEEETPLAKIDFIKDRVGVEVAFSHASFIGIDLLKFQTLSYSNLNKIDLGVYIVAT